MHKKYEDWLDRTNASFKILSESEWYAACKHFGGCAICGNESIEARAFFVPFGDGGRYTAWNIIPACGKCGVEAKINDNPFKWMTGLNAKNVGLTTERANKIIAYLEQQIEKVME